MSNKLNALDLAFLSLEKPSTPINVASLTILEIPKHYKGNYPLDLMVKLQSQPANPPFNQKLSSVHTTALPSWITDQRFDINYHVRHVALPKPGKLEDLLELTSRLHSQLLDRTRPLWEFYLIEGLEDQQFAMYLKMHHAAIDGMGGMELMKNWFNLCAGDEVKAPWACMPDHHDKPSHVSSGMFDAPAKLFDEMFSNSKMVQDLSKMLFGQYLKTIGFDKNTSPVPFSAPHSMFNVPINSTRSFVVKSVCLKEVEALGKQAKATVNDIVLTLCSSALRKYMMYKQELPKRSLIASVPVSVRHESGPGNQITYVMANLATDEPDTMTRIDTISKSTKDAKKELVDVSASAATNFAFLAQGLVAVLNQLNISRMMPPAANLVISNVPGPRKPLYFGQAKLKATYPLSVLIDGQALNITVVSYGDSINFGLLACRDTIPDLNILADHIESAIDDIKGALFLKDSMKEAKKLK
ncbi:wax ester/triacylglycerol synthase family O-acyltransferase [Glaciecola sp. XM2]|uniref:WS/DGAT/MGAT family O-acyltransferase n=1 Tax=Glaciecola sp. XM2 TaxID=1914931 RepID=UPI001BDDECFB|nr:wax ester/triacylglycerol synthase family O-acyltransferase [Glaciecola sp. XM2]MBT1449523.1 wax ester/triacylglycerol synthase family O-acyltransferase [Glaciecola sp. XM2]